jgi:hypothetical protein
MGEAAVSGGRSKHRSKFVVTLVPLPEVSDPVRAMRAALKALLRRFGLRCTDVREERVQDGGAS